MYRTLLGFFIFIVTLSSAWAQGQVRVSQPVVDPAQQVDPVQGALVVISSNDKNLAVSSPDLHIKAKRSSLPDGNFAYQLPLNWNDEYDDMIATISVLSPVGTASLKLELQRGKVYVATCTVGSTFLMLDEAYSQRPPGLLPVSGRSAVVINSSSADLSVTCDGLPLFVEGKAQPLPSGAPITRLGRTQNEQIYSDTIYFDLSNGATPQPKFQVSLGESSLSFVLPAPMGVKRVYRYMVIAIDHSEPHSAFLHIESNPSGADVIYQGGVVGKTPHDLFVQGTTATVTLQLPNYHEAIYNVPLRHDKEEIPIRAEMKPCFGTLTCTSSPSGAIVYIGSERLGFTPISRTVLSGNYTLRFAADLYDVYTQDIRIEDGQPLTVNATLVSACAEVQIHSLPRAAIYVDGKLLGRTSVIRTLGEGSHKLRASLSGYEPVETTINVVRNQPITVELNPSRDGRGSASVSQSVPATGGNASITESVNTPQQTAQETPQQVVQQTPQQTAQETPQQSVQQTPQQTAQKTPQQTPQQTAQEKTQPSKQSAQQPKKSEKANPYETFNRLNAEAERGDAKAQCLTGICYFKGEGVMRSLPSAFYYFALSAKQGYADAEYWVAYCFQHGYGTQLDLDKAKEYYQKAAAQGHAQAAQALQQL